MYFECWQQEIWINSCQYLFSFILVLNFFFLYQTSVFAALSWINFNSCWVGQVSWFCFLFPNLGRMASELVYHDCIHQIDISLFKFFVQGSKLNTWTNRKCLSTPQLNQSWPQRNFIKWLVALFLARLLWLLEAWTRLGLVDKFHICLVFVFYLSLHELWTFCWKKRCRGLWGLVVLFGLTHALITNPTEILGVSVCDLLQTSPRLFCLHLQVVRIRVYNLFLPRQRYRL